MSSNFTNIIKLLARAIKRNFLFSSDCFFLDYTAFTVRKPVASFVKTKTVIKLPAPAQTVVEVDIQDAIAMKVRV